MQVKKGKVQSVQSNGSIDLTHGTFYKFEISFEDGTIGEYLSKSADGGSKNFPIGQEKDYELTDNGKWGKKVKPHFAKPSFTPKQSFGNDDDRQKMIVKQSSIKVALDYCIARQKDKVDLNLVIETAEEIVKWVMHNAPAEAKEFTSIEKNNTNSNEDLPF